MRIRGSLSFLVWRVSLVSRPGTPDVGAVGHLQGHVSGGQALALYGVRHSSF